MYAGLTKLKLLRRSAVLTLLLFLTTVSYNGPAFGLRLLSVAWVLMFVWAITIIARTDLRRVSLASGWPLAFAAAYLAWLLLAHTVSHFPYVSSIQGAELSIAPFIFFAWLFEPDLDKSSAWQETWRLLLLCASALALWGVVDFFVFEERSHGPLIDPNAYAALVNLFLVPAVWSYLRAPDGVPGWSGPRLLLAIVALLSFALFASLSRGGLLAFLATLSFLLFLNRRNPLLYARLPLLLVLLATSYTLVKLGPVDQQGVETLLVGPGQHLASDRSVEERVLLWKATVRIIAEGNWLTGWGLGTFKTIYPAYRLEGERSLGNYAHNDYLQAMQEGGLVQLAFLLALTVALPAWLLKQTVSTTSRRSTNLGADFAPGLMLAVLCVSLHSLVNFVHFVVPIALLTGLYLGATWETVRRRSEALAVAKYLANTRPLFLKFLLIVPFALQTAAVGLDGLISTWFGGKSAFADPEYRIAALNASLALRPANPTARVALILHLLEVAERYEPSARYALLEQAEKEANALADHVPPQYALLPLLRGQIAALRGRTEDLHVARDYFQQAIRHAPHSTAMRVELIKTYRRLGHDELAYEVVSGARPWLPNETSMDSLRRFANEAYLLAKALKLHGEAEYWSSIGSQVAALVGETDNPLN